MRPSSFWWIGNQTTDIADLCGHVGHSQHFMMDGNKNNSNEKHDRENAAFSRFARNVAFHPTLSQNSHVIGVGESLMK